MVLTPGTYNAAAAASTTGTLSFDANGVTDPVWILNIGGAFNTAAGAKMEGDGTHADIHWFVDGAITLAANSFSIGSMTATGAITVGDRAECGDLDADGRCCVLPQILK